MSIAGKKSVHFIKKDIASQKTPAIGFKNLRFAHKASAGDTVINLASLSLPTEDYYASFVNPSLSELNSAQLLFNQKNLVLMSSLTGMLSSGSYKVTGNSSIELLEPALDGEIFEGIIAVTPRSGVQMVDAMPIVSTGTLAAGDDEYVVGQPFSVNKYPLSQQGEILVFLDGQLMRRNVGNATASPSADGDYELVDAGGGIGNIVKFNQTSGLDRVVTVVSNGLAFALPNDSVMALTESLAGQVDAMIPTLAALAGVPENTFQTAPNSIDLKSFGDRVLAAEGYIEDLSQTGNLGTPKPATELVKGAVFSPRVQVKTRSTSHAGTSPATLVSDVSFSNLVIGKWYRATLSVYDVGGAGHVWFQWGPSSSNSNYKYFRQFTANNTYTMTHVFQAAQTSFNVYHGGGSSSWAGVDGNDIPAGFSGGSPVNTVCILEELGDYESTSAFT